SPRVRLILASSSPRRRELLARLGLPFEVRPSDLEEALTPGIPPPALAATLARAKARAVAGRVHAFGEAPALILGPDTLGVLAGHPLGKPASHDDARRMLRLLRSRSHEVVTALALVLAAPGGREATQTVTSRVHMRAFTDAEVDAYVAS